MRILMITRPDAIAVLGGDTIQLQRTAAALRERGLEVEESIGAPPDEARARADVVHLFNLQTPDFTLSQARRAAELGKPIALSTIYWDFGAEQLLVQSPRWRLMARTFGRPIARWLAQRRVERVSRPERDKLREILARADVCLPNSQAEIGHLRSLLPSLGEVRVVPNAVDPERHRPGRGLALPSPLRAHGIEDHGYVLIAARIEPHKNQLAFCEAMRGTAMPIVLCGPAPDAAYLDACRTAGAIVLESLAGDELDAAMDHCRVHALPSYRETPGLASLEAAALGAAIVTTSVGSAREYFLDEAEYCEPWNPTSMRMATERAWRNGVPPNLSDRIRRDFSWARAAEATHRAYDLALAQRSG